MAYYLEFDGSNDYVSTGHHLNIDFTSDDYEVEFELDFTGSKNGTICSQCISDGIANREFHVFIASSNFNVWFVTAGDVIDTGYRPLSRETLVLSVNTSIGTYAMTSDGLTVASGNFTPFGASEPSATFLIGARYGGNLSSFAFFNKADLYRLKIRKGATLIHDYNPSASGGTDSTLPDIEGGQDGTLVNFPVDDSQWVFYDDGGTLHPVMSVTDFSLSLRQSVLSSTTISTALRAYKENVTALSAVLRQVTTNTTQLNASLREQVANTTTITTSLLNTILNGVAGVTSFNFALRSQTQNTITIETSLRELVSSNTELSTALRTGVISTHDIDTALRQGVQSVTPFAFNLIGGIVGITSLNTQLRESIDSTTNFTLQLFGEIDWNAPGKQALFTIQVTPANFTISTQKPEL